MKKLLVVFAMMVTIASYAQQTVYNHRVNQNLENTVENYIKEFPNQEQVKMMNTWLEKNKKGTFQFTGLVDPTDATVVTPQATVSYGYNWFSLSDGYAIINTPKYDKYFSVSIFDMYHNIPSVIVSPDKPILLIRPNQEMPEGNFTIVYMETDQGLAFTRMVIVDNENEVDELSKEITMEGGKGDMTRYVERFSAHVEKKAHAVIDATFPILSKDAGELFGYKSGDVGAIGLAVGVKYGQLGTPSQLATYDLFLADSDGKPLDGNSTYEITVPANTFRESGYMSVTLYGVDNKLLIPNEKGVYDQTSYSAKPNEDSTYTITVSPKGDGKNGIPTGKNFYGVLRVYEPIGDAKVIIKKIK
ncbi:MAG: DUF1214 domain-containing protein [Bacteroidota bacterium]|nr:DUF1214 domain-containing protein [Bacteroidota bacterium]